MLEQLPDLNIVGLTAGYAVGQALDVYTTNKSKNDIGSVSSSHESVAKELDNSVRVSELSRSIGRRILAPLALSGLVSGGLLGLAYSSEPTNARVPANIEIVVDHSGFTANDGTVAKTNNIVEQFSSNKNFKSEALVAGSGQITPMNPGDVASNTAFGVAPLDQALTQAIGQIQNINSAPNSSKAEGAVLVVTDDNNIGSLQTAEALAQPGHIPIFTVNVSPNSTNNSATIGELSKATNAKNWTNPSIQQQSQIASEVYSSLSSNQGNSVTKVNPDKGLLKILSLCSLAATGVLAWNRKYVMYRRNMRGK